MVMNPRTHPRGAAPDFTLPRPNPNPSRMTDALWWLVCMREALEPALSENGGTFADKPGYHDYGSGLPDYGLGNLRTDHSIRRAPDREGPWWKSKCSAHDWTFRDAQGGDYKTITKYTKRLIASMRDPNDPRPDDVFAYTLGQTDGDSVVEGYSEYKDDVETSGDKTHLWHRHDSFRRNIVGSFPHMWRALTIDMGWTVAEWRKSLGQVTVPGGVKMVKVEGELPVLRQGMTDPVPGVGSYYIKRVQTYLNWVLPGEAPIKIDGDYGQVTANGVKVAMQDLKDKSSSNGSIVGLPEWNRIYAL